MFRQNLKINDRSDIDAECRNLRKNAERARLSNSAINCLIEEFVDVVVPLVESGVLMRAQGSSLNVSRSIKGAGYEVQLEFSTVRNELFFDRLKSLFWGR